MTTYSDIFVEASSELDLRSFSSQVFEIFGIADFEERESSHYVDGHYFRSKADDLQIKVTFTDDSDLDGYRFWLPISSTNESIDAAALADTYAKKLSTAGWAAFVPAKDWNRKDWLGEGVRYDV
ncbi:hypothetical protein [Undibacterium flavidum]|uniref:CYTH domain-containing protein n=1 Tax=Undibacterium flavidum TaxID=2762297 RepID=A0ABR6Y9X4_9BURK|nr:hypothetical protein [Undibacterium flavidum]MBC3873383.1 hypothetical protein [Undibacterium flavidum]